MATCGVHSDTGQAAIRAWAVENGRLVASTGRIPAELREAWLEATGGVVADDRAARPTLGHTEAAQAYRLLHTGMAQAVSDGLIPANPCAIKGASQRDSRHRGERRVLTPDELWALTDAMPERYRAARRDRSATGLTATGPQQRRRVLSSRVTGHLAGRRSLISRVIACAI